jgi:hypothetical protein
VRRRCRNRALSGPWRDEFIVRNDPDVRAALDSFPRLQQLLSAPK